MREFLIDNSRKIVMDNWPRYFGTVSAHVVMVAASVAFFYRDLTEGEVLYQDDSRVFYFPLMSVVASALKQGSLPLWSPNMYGGYPIFADGEAGILYPLNLLFLPFLPTEEAFVWLRVVRFFLAGVFTYHYARVIGCRAFGALVAGIVFMFSGFAVAQLVHTNLSQGAIWLPLVLLFSEKAAQNRAGKRYLYLLFAGVAISMQALAVHVQPLIMSAMTVAAYLAYRLLWESGSDLVQVVRSHWSPLWKLLGSWMIFVATPLLIAISIGLVAAVGIGLAAVQLLPLYELGEEAARGAGSPLILATTNSVHPLNLITLFLPRFFSLPNGDYWGLWVQWETTIYVGIPTVIFVLFAIVFHRGRYVAFYVGLAVVALLMAFGKYSPVPMFQLFHDLPHMDVLRSPGRFSYLFTLAVAILAGLGADWLDRRRDIVRTPRCGVFILGLGLFAIVFAAYANVISDFIRAHRDVSINLIEQWYYLPSDEGVPFKPEEAYRFLLEAMRGEHTAYAALVLTTCFVLLMAWRGSKAKHSILKTTFVALLLVDLILPGMRFHSRLPVEDLTATSLAAEFLEERRTDGRVYSRLGLDRGLDTEPNRLLRLGVSEANGYSSLELKRHTQYAARVDYTENSLLDLWNVRYLLVRNKYVSLPSYEGTQFHPDYPLLSSTSQNPNAKITFNVQGELSSEIRLVALLREAPNVPQGTEVAQVFLTDMNGGKRVLPLRAGVEISDWAADSSDYGHLVKHSRAKVALSIQTGTPGAMVRRNYYYARIPIVPPVLLKRVEFQYTHPMGVMQLYGAGIFNVEKREVTQLRQRGKFKLVHKDKQVLVYENEAAMPRVFLVPSVVVASPGADILLQMSEGRFDPRRMAVLEEYFDSSLLSEPDSEPQPAVTMAEWARTRKDNSAKIVDNRPQQVTIQARSEKNSFLVLSDVYYPGWKAFVDGEEVKQYRANFLFRGIYLPKGEHIVEFRFEPSSVFTGGAITLVTGLGLLLCVLAFCLWRLFSAVYEMRLWRQQDLLAALKEQKMQGIAEPSLANEK